LSPIDRNILADKASAVEHHLERVFDKLPDNLEDFEPSTDESDAVILHLWQAVQIVIDVALATCVQRNWGLLRATATRFAA
jgi:hypothetical protein